jgi:S-adenosylmethionine:tRNA-ribosyltransferase-isomerase (queuine synthetase)
LTELEKPNPKYTRDVTQKMQNVTKLFLWKRGSVAAPTAGLHFQSIIKKLEIKGIYEVTLHVGLEL